MNYDDLNNAFTQHTYFYEVVGISMSEALDRCARLTGEDAHISNFGGAIVLSVKHELSSDITWLRAVPGNPVAEEPAPETPPA